MDSRGSMAVREPVFIFISLHYYRLTAIPATLNGNIRIAPTSLKIPPIANPNN
ncbi:hypothetical protein C900_02942 [Fulvivirga imtechensis AK7]|uniref:Uncharacterized protein n=1 Tax=Fulvivirga imtechensis AK7 TaxID=1237149 RepID=L8JVS8_9BACT|nr:hypothetical protein C900_02942 [Fulvivirga imtechensis AK7]